MVWVLFAIKKKKFRYLQSKQAWSICYWGPHFQWNWVNWTSRMTGNLYRRRGGSIFLCSHYCEGNLCSWVVWLCFPALLSAGCMLSVWNEESFWSVFVYSCSIRLSNKSCLKLSIFILEVTKPFVFKKGKTWMGIFSCRKTGKEEGLCGRDWWTHKSGRNSGRFQNLI